MQSQQRMQKAIDAQYRDISWIDLENPSDTPEVEKPSSKRSSFL